MRSLSSVVKSAVLAAAMLAPAMLFTAPAHADGEVLKIVSAKVSQGGSAVDVTYDYTCPQGVEVESVTVSIGDLTTERTGVLLLNNRDGQIGLACDGVQHQKTMQVSVAATDGITVAKGDEIVATIEIITNLGRWDVDVKTTLE
ncbi:hypothetical protein ACWCYY_31865 [Kitasatospora sp. NPDC001664]|uniref:hypothetical protein n=1 Tax=Kitasatospora albolonga TaxID=68173 RepID=UPI0035E57E23